MKTSLVLEFCCLFIGAYSAPSTSFETRNEVSRDGQYPYHVAIVTKKTNGFRCDGVIISNKLVMTMKKCLTRTTGEILVSPTDIALVVGGVVNLASDNAEQLTYSVSSFEIPKQSPSLPIIVLKVEEGKDLLTQVGDVRPKVAVFEKFGDTDEGLNGLKKRFQGMTLYA